MMPCVAWDLERKGCRHMIFQTLEVLKEEEKTNMARVVMVAFFSSFFFLFGLC